jgi:hypothetical protein
MPDGEAATEETTPEETEQETTETGTTETQAGDTDEWPQRMESIRGMVREELDSRFSALPDQLKTALTPATPKSPPKTPAPKAPAKEPEPAAPPPPVKRKWGLVANPRRKPRA